MSDGDYVITPPAIFKKITKELSDEASRFVDNVDRKDVRQVLLIALTEREMTNLRTIIEREKSLKNYGALTRRLINRAAKEAA